MLKIVLAQINAHVGNIKKNASKIIIAIQTAMTAHQADIIVFPELALTGYPPEDLLLREDFLTEIHQALDLIQQEVTDFYVILGTPYKTNNGLYNAALVFHNQSIITNYYKQALPNYGVFDEQRYFNEGNKPCVLTINDQRLGIMICEDIWQPAPLAQLHEHQVQFAVVLNASPFEAHKAMQRYETLRARQQETSLPLLYVNLVGGQDDIVFDGGSLALSHSGEIIMQADYFKEELALVTVNNHGEFEHSQKSITHPTTEQLIYEALVLALRDYVQKNHFHHVVLGLSGGIDSALTLAIAVDALGAQNVHAVMMPSQYTSQLSLDEAQAQANLLKVEYSIFSIDAAYQTFSQLLNHKYTNQINELTDQNIQARCRAIILMAISNNTGALVINTSNKSELAVGYGTLYGDMVGAFAVLKDVYKTMVYQLADYRNKLSLVIPQAVIDRAPSAELAENQTDQDSLPPYPILDEILQRYLEQNQSTADIIQSGFKSETVKKVTCLIKRNEYKRRQAPPGAKITPRAFGRERRFPITSGADV